MTSFCSTEEEEKILEEIAALEPEWTENGDHPWRAMAIVLQMRRFIWGTATLIRSTSETVTLSNLSEYIQLVLEQGRQVEFQAWNFDIHRSPAILSELACNPSAGFLNARLADGQYDVIAVLLAHKIIAAENKRLTADT